jgi:hypothetical protein
VNWEEEICGKYEGKTPPVRPSHNGRTILKGFVRLEKIAQREAS